MDRKTIICTVVIGAAAVLAAAVGCAVGLWDIGFEPESLIGFAAIIPAVIWIFAKGLNYVNSGIYFAGIGYIMYKNLFDGFSARFAVLCVLLALLAAAVPATASAFRKEQPESAEQNEQQERIEK